MAIDHDLAAKLAEKAFTAVQAGAKATLDNPNEISQTVMAVLAVSLNAVPVVGGAIAAFAVALSLIAFPAPAKDPWDKVRERVEALVGQKLQAAQLKSLQSKVDGFRLNSDHYAKVWKSFHDAPADAREKQAELLRTHHSGFLLQLRSGIPEFQIDDYAAAALPLFAQAANVHLALLADGIRNGKDWGFPEEHYGKTLPEEFEKMTASGGNKAARGVEARAAADSALLDMGKAAIDAAEGLGVDPELLALWKAAYASLVHQFAVRSPETEKRSTTTDYVAHVKKWYVEGRKQVTPRQWNRDEGKPYYDRGHKEALALATYSDYDMEMVENVLNYAEFWPYLATDGATLSAASLRNLDREVFRGPYMRYTEHAPWTAAAAPPVTDRGAPITAVRMCVSENVRELQVRYGDKWGPVFGKCHDKAKEERSFTLKDGEYIENVDIVTGHKLGQLHFYTNLGSHGPFGDPTHADLPISVNRTGYALTSMYSTHYEQAAPEGIEGIFFGFRPLLTAKKE